MRYLITGGAGFIGSHLADYLIARGHSVHVVDNLSTGRLTNIQHLNGHARFRVTIADVLDYGMLEPLVAGCDQIFHLAAAVGVKLIMESPVQTIVTNVQGTENVLKLACQYDRKVLVASTSEVYGKVMDTNGDLTSLREEDDWTLGPTSKRRWAYACAKALDEFLALAYHEEKQLPTVIVRFFNTVGPRQTGRYGMVIPNFVQRALMNEPLYVFGDGGQARCFTYVGDAVRAVTALMETPEAVGQVFNVGSQEEITINALAEKIRRMTDSRSEILHVPYEQVYEHGFEDMRRRMPDTSKLRRIVGFEPSYSIEHILQEVIKHFRHQEGIPELSHRIGTPFDVKQSAA